MPVSFRSTLNTTCLRGVRVPETKEPPNEPKKIGDATQRGHTEAIDQYFNQLLQRPVLSSHDNNNNRRSLPTRAQRKRERAGEGSLPPKRVVLDAHSRKESVVVPPLNTGVFQRAHGAHQSPPSAAVREQAKQQELMRMREIVHSQVPAKGMRNLFGVNNNNDHHHQQSMDRNRQLIAPQEGAGPPVGLSSRPAESRLVILPGGVYARAGDIFVEHKSEAGMSTIVDSVGKNLYAVPLAKILERYELLDADYNRIKREVISLKRKLFDSMVHGK